MIWSPKEASPMMRCTPVTAAWCPICGTCTCDKTTDGTCCFDDDACPLHGSASKHADTIELKRCEEMVDGLAHELGVELNDNDRSELSRFARYLFERQRQQQRNR